MRFIIMLIVLSFAGTCFAEDPLESLNTVEDTVTTMQQTLKEQGAEQLADHADGATPGTANGDAQTPQSDSPSKEKSAAKE